MLELNKWFFVQVINFLLLIILLNQILFKPLLRLFKERQDHVKNSLDRAKSMDKEREDLLNKINTKLFEARNQAKTILEGLKKEGINMQKELVDATQKDALEISSKAQKELHAESERARKALRADVEKFSNEIVRKLIRI